MSESAEPRTKAGRAHRRYLHAVVHGLGECDDTCECHADILAIESEAYKQGWDTNTATSFGNRAALPEPSLDVPLWLRKVRERLTAYNGRMDYHRAMLCVESVEAEYARLRGTERHGHGHEEPLNGLFCEHTAQVRADPPSPEGAEPRTEAADRFRHALRTTVAEVMPNLAESLERAFDEVMREAAEEIFKEYARLRGTGGAPTDE